MHLDRISTILISTSPTFSPLHLSTTSPHSPAARSPLDLLLSAVTITTPGSSPNTRHRGVKGWAANRYAGMMGKEKVGAPPPPTHTHTSLPHC